MTRTPVDSSNIHSMGWDETGQEVQFHAKECARRRSVGKGEAYGHPGVCDCKGGDVYHHAGVPAELHSMTMSAPSVGSFYMRYVRGAKNGAGELKYPVVKAVLSTPAPLKVPE